MKCDCHGKNHHDDSLTVLPVDYMAGDPQPSMPGAPSHVVFCPAGLRARERRQRGLKRGRRAYRKGAAA